MASAASAPSKRQLDVREVMARRHERPQPTRQDLRQHGAAAHRRPATGAVVDHAVVGEQRRGAGGFVHVDDDGRRRGARRRSPAGRRAAAVGRWSPRQATLCVGLPWCRCRLAGRRWSAARGTTDEQNCRAACVTYVRRTSVLAWGLADWLNGSSRSTSTCSTLPAPRRCSAICAVVTAADEDGRSARPPRDPVTGGSTRRPRADQRPRHAPAGVRGPA